MPLPKFALNFLLVKFVNLPPPFQDVGFGGGGGELLYFRLVYI